MRLRLAPRSFATFGSTLLATSLVAFGQNPYPGQTAPQDQTTPAQQHRSQPTASQERQDQTLPPSQIPATGPNQTRPTPHPTAAQERADQTAASNRSVVTPHSRSAGGDIGSGAGDIGKGTAHGAGHIAAGAGKGAVDLVTLHPINAAGAVGTGAVKGGKDIAIGAGKGTGKILKGTGRAIGHIF